MEFLLKFDKICKNSSIDFFKDRKVLWIILIYFFVKNSG